jgi:hypothetical protein
MRIGAWAKGGAGVAWAGATAASRNKEIRHNSDHEANRIRRIAYLHYNQQRGFGRQRRAVMESPDTCSLTFHSKAITAAYYSGVAHSLAIYWVSVLFSSWEALKMFRTYAVKNF